MDRLLEKAQIAVWAFSLSGVCSDPLRIAIRCHLPILALIELIISSYSIFGKAMKSWLFSNVVIPVLVPTICIAVLKIANTDISIKKTLRDGQLGWVAVCFAASAKYELKQISPTPEWFELADWFTLLFILLSSLLTAYVTVHPFNEEAEKSKKVMMKYRVMIATGVATLLSGLMYTLIHYSLESAAKGVST